jgi:hypothetical protein
VKIFRAIPLNLPEGVFVVVVLLTDISGGSRGRVPCREMMGFIEVTRVSMEGVGSGMAGEFGSWILW